MKTLKRGIRTWKKKLSLCGFFSILFYRICKASAGTQGELPWGQPARSVPWFLPSQVQATPLPPSHSFTCCLPHWSPQSPSRTQRECHSARGWAYVKNSQDPDSASCLSLSLKDTLQQGRPQPTSCPLWRCLGRRAGYSEKTPGTRRGAFRTESSVGTCSVNVE